MRKFSKAIFAATGALGALTSLQAVAHPGHFGAPGHAHGAPTPLDDAAAFIGLDFAIAMIVLAFAALCVAAFRGWRN